VKNPKLYISDIYLLPRWEANIPGQAESHGHTYPPAGAHVPDYHQDSILQVAVQPALEIFLQAPEVIVYRHGPAI